MSHCAVGVCSSPVHCTEIGRCFATPQPAAPGSLVLDPSEVKFLAARLRRLFAHFRVPVPNADDDASVIGNAGAGIGLLLGRSERPVLPSAQPEPLRTLCYHCHGTGCDKCGGVGLDPIGGTAGVKPHGDCPNIVGSPREGYSCRIGCGEQCEHPAGVAGGNGQTFQQADTDGSGSRP